MIPVSYLLIVLFASCLYRIWHACGWLYDATEAWSGLYEHEKKLTPYVLSVLGIFIYLWIIVSCIAYWKS